MNILIKFKNYLFVSRRMKIKTVRINPHFVHHNNFVFIHLGYCGILLGSTRRLCSGKFKRFNVV